MAFRFLPLLLLGIFMAAMGLAAPISHADSSLAFGALLAERSVSSATTATTTTIATGYSSRSSRSSRSKSSRGSRFLFMPRLLRIFRLDKPAPLASAAERQAPAYFLEPSLGLIETSVDIQAFPVFAAAGNKRVTADTNGDLLTVTYGDNRFVPVWARPWTSRRFRGALRFSQGLAVFILGSSLGMALVCAYWRSLCSKREQQLEIRDWDSAATRLEEGGDNKPDEESMM